METIDIAYVFHQEKHSSQRFEFQIDADTLTISNPPDSPLPEWAALEFHQCSHCPLHSDASPYCPVAACLVDVVSGLDNIVSHDEMDVEVIMPERNVSRHTTAQRGISSMLGLLFATSGCPHTAFLKPMARFHLPFASEQDTIFRATGMYLLAQYFRKKEGHSTDLELDGLTELYDNLHVLNAMMAKRIRSATTTDSSVNAVILLDMFTNLMPFVIEEKLEDIHHLFRSFLIDK